MESLWEWFDFYAEFLRDTFDLKRCLRFFCFFFICGLQRRRQIRMRKVLFFLLGWGGPYLNHPCTLKRGASRVHLLLFGQVSLRSAPPPVSSSSSTNPWLVLLLFFFLLFIILDNDLVLREVVAVSLPLWQVPGAIQGGREKLLLSGLCCCCCGCWHCQAYEQGCCCGWHRLETNITITKINLKNQPLCSQDISKLFEERFSRKRASSTSTFLSILALFSFSSALSVVADIFLWPRGGVGWEPLHLHKHGKSDDNGDFFAVNGWHRANLPPSSSSPFQLSFSFLFSLRPWKKGAAAWGASLVWRMVLHRLLATSWAETDFEWAFLPPLFLGRKESTTSSLVVVMYREKGNIFSASSLPEPIMSGVWRNGQRGISLLLTLQKSQFCSKSQFNERFCPGQVTSTIKQHRTFAPTFVFRLASLLRLLQFKLFLLSLCLFGYLQNLLAHFSRLFLQRRGKKYWSYGAVGRSRAIHILRAAKTRRGERKCKNNFGVFFPATAASSKRPPTIFVADAIREQVLLIFICGAADRSGRGKRCSFCCCGGDHFLVSHVQFFGVWKGKTFVSKGVWNGKNFVSKWVWKGKNFVKNIIFQAADQWKYPFLALFQIQRILVYTYFLRVNQEKQLC